MINFEAKSIARAKQIRESLGGTLFAFPIEEDNPFSSYAIVMYAGGKYFAYSQCFRYINGSHRDFHSPGGNEEERNGRRL